MSSAVKRPRAQMSTLAEELLDVLGDACVKIEIAGSLRREVPLVGDIELVAIPKVETYEETDPEDLFGMAKPVTYNLLWKSLNAFFKGKYRVSGEKYKSFFWPFGPNDPPVQIDLFTATPETWGWIYLIRTGSSDFSHHVARCLNKAGYASKDGAIHKATLEMVSGEWKMVPFGPPIKTPTEQDVFDLARIPYRDPKQRF